MSDINEVRERLERACIAGMDAEYVDDVVALLDDHERLNELLGNSEQLQPPPAADPEDVRIVRIIAEKIDEGRLDHPGFYKNGRLSAALRNLLALIDGQTGRHASDEQYADADALVAHLASLMDDGGQGGEHWEPAKAAIAGIRAWQSGELELPDLCDMCRTRQEVRSDAEGIPFCQECWDGWQASEQPTKGEGA